MTTRYAKVGDAHVAYRTWGEGPPDLLYFDEIPVDMLEDEPRLARALKRLSSFGRVIVFNPRGLGLSDALGRPGVPSMDDRLDDGIAVLDACGSDKAMLLGLVAFIVHAALDFAARRPERVSGLVLVNGRARWLWDEDYTFGIPPDEAQQTTRRVTDPETDAASLPQPAPSVAGDKAWAEWWERAGHRRASPAMAAAVMQHRMELDQRPLLAQIGCPTLVVQRTDVQLVPVEHGRYLADHIPNARLVELPGIDTIWWVGDADALLDEIELFVTQGTVRRARRALSTVLFVDVVGSTVRASEMGDQRWRELLETYNGVVSSAIGRSGGRLIGTEGDGCLATFDVPADAIRCAQAIRDGARSVDVEVRAGVHTGEIELQQDDIAGIGVHIAARVKEAAGAGEIFVSRTVVDLVGGSGLSFEDRGEHDLKGVPDAWRLFAVRN